MIISIIQESLRADYLPITCRLPMAKPKPASTKNFLSADALLCKPSLVHLDNVRQVQPEVLETEKAQQMAEFFSALSDPHRLKLLSALAQRELCVCDLAAAVKMGESAVSHQLRVLRSQHLVKYRRQGRKAYYSMADGHIMTIYRVVAEHLDEE
jgi:ArsR family transcriptional regulator, lead/cadmium/zinc/bismuth-responsive transcriptional repressor